MADDFAEFLTVPASAMLDLPSWYPLTARDSDPRVFTVAELLFRIDEAISAREGLAVAARFDVNLSILFTERPGPAGGGGGRPGR